MNITIRMKKTLMWLSIVLILAGCRQASSGETTEKVMEKALNWREQYDLGMRYLEEERYEEAIVVFTEVIEIDPKQPEVYVARGDAYIFYGETEKNLASAQKDYEAALNLDEAFVQAYLGLADVYIRQGEYDTALEILKQGLEKTEGDEEIAEKIAEFESGTITDSEKKIRRMSLYDGAGDLMMYYMLFYDESDRECRVESYNEAGVQTGTVDILYDEKGNKIQDWGRIMNTGEMVKHINEYNGKKHLIKRTLYSLEDIMEGYDTFEYDSDGNQIKMNQYSSEDDLERYYVTEYDEKGRVKKFCDYETDGSLNRYTVYEYDSNGKSIENTYNSQGKLIYYSVYEYDSDGNILNCQVFDLE